MADVAERCPGGPARCVDDLCRNSDVGLCGAHREDYLDEENDHYEDWDEEE